MNRHHGSILLSVAMLLVSSCTIYEKLFDNPVDYKANDELGVGAPALVFYPKTQTSLENDSLLIGSFIVFKDDSISPFSGVHLQIKFPNSLLGLDTVKPGLFITDTNKSTPLFVYTYDSANTIDIYAYFLDTLKRDLLGTGHLADIVFNPVTTGSDSIFYNLIQCEMIDHEDNIVALNGERGAEVIID